jgi:hypothetical protein
VCFFVFLFSAKTKAPTRVSHSSRSTKDKRNHQKKDKERKERKERKELKERTNKSEKKDKRISSPGVDALNHMSQSVRDATLSTISNYEKKERSYSSGVDALNRMAQSVRESAQSTHTKSTRSEAKTDHVSAQPNEKKEYTFWEKLSSAYELMDARESMPPTYEAGEDLKFNQVIPDPATEQDKRDAWDRWDRK